MKLERKVLAGLLISMILAAGTLIYAQNSAHQAELRNAAYLNCAKMYDTAPGIGSCVHWFTGE